MEGKSHRFSLNCSKEVHMFHGSRFKDSWLDMFVHFAEMFEVGPEFPGTAVAAFRMIHPELVHVIVHLKSEKTNIVGVLMFRLFRRFTLTACSAFAIASG